MTQTCPVEGCGAPVAAGSRTQVCRRHIHSAPFCACRQCAGLSGPIRIKSRAEMVAEGLLPRVPLFRFKEP